MDHEQLQSDVKVLRSQILCYHDHVKQLERAKDKALVITTKLNRTGGSLIIVSKDKPVPNSARRTKLLMNLGEVNQEIVWLEKCISNVEKFLRSLQPTDREMFEDYARGESFDVMAGRYSYARGTVAWRLKSLMSAHVRGLKKD